MEFLLNLTWLLVGVCVFAMWWRSPERTLRQVPAHRVPILLCCCLVLLFPIISASDDAQLQREFIDGPVVTAMEDGTVKHFAPACDLLQRATLTSSAQFQAPGDSITGWTSPLDVQPPLPGFTIGDSGRAPPAAIR